MSTKKSKDKKNTSRTSLSGNSRLSSNTSRSNYVSRRVPTSQYEVYTTTDNGELIVSVSGTAFRLYWPGLYAMRPNYTGYFGYLRKDGSIMPIGVNDTYRNKFIDVKTKEIEQLTRSSSKATPQSATKGQVDLAELPDNIADPYDLYVSNSAANKLFQETFWNNSKDKHDQEVAAADARVRATAPSNHPFQMAAGVGVGTLLSLGYLTNPFGTTAALMAFPYGNLLFNDIWSGTAPYGYVHQNVPTEFRSGTWNEDVSRGLQGLGMQKDNADLVAEFSNPGGLTISGLAAKAARPLDNAYNRWLVNNGHVYKTNNVFRSVIGDLNKESITSSITNLGKNLKSKLLQTYKNFKLKSIQSYLDKISNSDYILSSKELNYLKDNLSKNSSILKDLNFNFRDLPTQVRKLLYDIVEKDGAKTGYVVEPKKKVINRADISLSNGIEDLDIMKLLKPVMSDIYEYKLNPERLLKTREALGWDEQALLDYIEELNLLITLPRGFKILNEPSHLRASLGTTHINPIRQEVMVNKAAISDLDELYEALLHEIGGHGSTGQVSIDHPLMLTRFPRTWEVIQYNDKLSKDLLVPTDRTIRNSKEIFEQVEDLKYHGVSDNEIESLLPFINSNKNYMDYIKRDLELQTRVHTSNMADKVWPELVSINERSLLQFFTPESILKLKKAILTISPAIPIGASTDYYKEK